MLVWVQERGFTVQLTLPLHQAALCCFCSPEYVFLRVLVSVAQGLHHTALKATFTAVLEAAALSQDVLDSLFVPVPESKCWVSSVKQTIICFCSAQ